MAEYNYDLIYRYLNGEMETKEKEEFEDLINKDPDLKQEIDFNRELMMGIQLAGDQELRESIQHTHEHLEKNGLFAEISNEDQEKPHHISNNIRRFSFQQYFGIAAAVLILISIGYFLFQPKIPSAEVIYANHYLKDSIILTEQLDLLSLQGMAIRDKDRRESLKLALELYRDKNYAHAINKLQKHLQTYPEDDVATLFLGLSLMETGSFTEATVQLEKVANNYSSKYHESATWYLGLAYLHSVEEKAISIFKDISVNDTSDFQDRAKKILELLE